MSVFRSADQYESFQVKGGGMECEHEQPSHNQCHYTDLTQSLG